MASSWEKAIAPFHSLGDLAMARICLKPFIIKGFTVISGDSP